MIEKTFISSDINFQEDNLYNQQGLKEQLENILLKIQIFKDMKILMIIKIQFISMLFLKSQ